MSETLKAIVHVNRLEPGNHFSRKTIQRDVTPATTFNIPADECKEIRPDWGVYHPIKTFPALERTLRRMGAFSAAVGEDCVFSFGFLDA